MPRTQFLHTTNFVKGIFAGLAEKFSFNRTQTPSGLEDLGDFKLAKVIKNSHEANSFKVGEYTEARTGQKAIVKILRYKFKNLMYFLLQNEISFLQFFAMPGRDGIIAKKVRVPKLLRVVGEEGEVGFISEFLEGDLLEKKPVDEKLQTLKLVVGELAENTGNLSKTELDFLPKRKAWQIALLFPYYVFRLAVKDFPKFYRSVNLVFLFVKFSFSKNSFFADYELAHRDLSSENIVVTPNGATVIDWEVAALSPKGTDLAMAARYYVQEVPPLKLAEFLASMLDSGTKRKEFLRLTIFYTFQFMSVESKESKFYLQAYRYLEILQNEILPALPYGRLRPAKILHSLVLKTIYFLALPFAGKSAAPLVLDYHSVSSDSWDYSTPLENFKAQIEHLQKERKIVSLAEILSGPYGNKAAITFDDGYEDVFSEAYPFLKQRGLKAAVFVIGNSEKADRKELGNTKPFLSDSQIKQLHADGWEIGFHTSSHRNLALLTEQELREEIVQGKRDLEQRLGFKVDYFSYPRGFSSESVVNLVKEAGFKAAFTVDGGLVQTGDLYKIPRVSPEGDVNIKEFSAAVSRPGLLFERIYMSALKAKEEFQRGI